MATPSLSFADRVMGTDPHQRIRLMQSSIATVLMCASALGVNYLAWAELARPGPVAWWTVVTLGTFAGFLLVIRLGLNRHFAEASLSVPQMTAALLSSAWAYTFAGPGRGAVFPAPIVVLMFGMYALAPATVRRLGAFAIILFGAAMAGMAIIDPAVYEPRVEIVHFGVLAVMLMAVAMLAGQLAALRRRLRAQKAELAKALSRIQGLATRDDLTGLVNRRYAQEVLTLEHQRCMRSGHPFSIAMIDLDHFKAVNDTHGHAAGDEVLRRFASEAREAIRISDVLARWGGEEFLLLMTDTRGSLGRLGVERLRERISRMAIGVDGTLLQLTLSAGLAEHLAGEPIADTIARADQALYAAKAQGRNRVVVL